MDKLSGILDTPRAVLAPDVWTTSQRLQPALREQILQKITALLPKTTTIMGVYIIGSITGYKYHETTDIDINVHVQPYDHEAIGKTRLTRSINGFMSYGGRHPVSFFVQEYKEGAT